MRLITSQSTTLRRVRTSQVRIIIAVESCEIPARSEAIIKGRIQGKPPLSDMIFGPSSNQMVHKGVYAAKSLLNAKCGIMLFV